MPKSLQQLSLIINRLLIFPKLTNHSNQYIRREQEDQATRIASGRPLFNFEYKLYQQTTQIVNRIFQSLGLLTLGLFLLCASANAQTKNQKIDIKAELSHAQFIGTTPVMRDMVPKSQSDRDRAKEARKHHEIPKNFMGRDIKPPQKSGTFPQGDDPIVQSGISGGGIVIEPLVNMDGLSSNFGSPHDPSGDIGADYYVQAINATRIGIYDKEGNFQMDFTGNSLWSSLGFSSAGDPIVLYDQSESKWIITEFANQGNRLMIAVSTSGDPTGSYNVFAFSTPSFPDYPKYAIWTDALVVTTNEDGSAGSPSYHINKQDLYAAVANPEIQRISLPGLPGGPGFFIGTPVDWSGNTPPPAGTKQYIVRLRDDNWGAVTTDAVELYELDIVWGNVGASSANMVIIPTSPYDSNGCTGGGFFDCIPQGGNAGNVDGMTEFIMNQPHYRNFGTHESMVMAWTVDKGSNTAAIRWMELRRTGASDWAIYQESTYGADDGLQRFAPAICFDQSGNIGMAFTTSSSSEFLSLKFTGRRESDALGEMTVVETAVVDGLSSNSAPQGGGNRYLDYPHMSVDPLNGRTFWFTSEYAGTGGNSRTRILSFELSRDTIDIGPSALLTPQDAGDLADETIAMTIENFGLTTQNIFLAGYIVDDQDPVIESIGEVIPPGGTYDYAFGPTADFSEAGEYEVKLFTVLDNDSNLNNDTLRVTVTNLPRWDAAITDISFPDENPCLEEKTAVATITNYGSDVLVIASLWVELNGNIVDILYWNGAIQTGQSTTVEIPISNAISGENQLAIRTNLPNNEDDQIPENDEFSRTFTSFDGEEFSFILTTDLYPDEISWEIEDEAGNILFEGGGNYSTSSTSTENFCLPAGQCFDFTINDSYGDGICCMEGNGSYSIVNSEGTTIVNSNGQYGSGETQMICTEEDACALTAEVNASPESLAGAGDGVLLIEPANGVGPYQFSINNGPVQNNGMFSGLAGGSYTILITDQNECDFTQSIVITTCKMEVVVVTGSETAIGAENGTISIDASNGDAPYQYSIDGGVSFLTASSFALLAPGDYDVVVIDALGCQEIATVEVSSFTTGLESNEYNVKVEVLPNPTNGLFRVNVEGIESDGPFLDYQIYDVSGKKLHSGIIARYDNRFTGNVSLIHYPDGMYFMKFKHQKINELVRVIKSN